MDDDFKTASKEFNEIESQVKEMRKTMKELSGRKSTLSQFITEYMESNKKYVVKLSPHDGNPGCRITLKKRQAFVPLSKDEMMRVFMSYFEGDETKAENLVSYVFAHRGKVERASLWHRKEG